MIAYTPAFVGTVEDPLYLTSLTFPTTELDITTACCDPLYGIEGFDIDNVGVALFIVKFLSTFGAESYVSFPDCEARIVHIPAVTI